MKNNDVPQKVSRSVRSELKSQGQLSPHGDVAGIAVAQTRGVRNKGKRPQEVQDSHQSQDRILRCYRPLSPTFPNSFLIQSLCHNSICAAQGLCHDLWDKQKLG